MRIVAGFFKGRSLLEFKGENVRPTLDMARESLFNIIKDKVVNADFLDLYCGTGAVGIEALSRGAKSVAFNDVSRDSINLTKKNLEKVDKEKIVNVGKNVIFYNYDATVFLTSVNKKFDIIFIDAPYGTKNIDNVIIACERILNENGIIIFEDQQSCELQLENLVLYDKRKYGRAHFSFFKKA